MRQFGYFAFAAVLVFATALCIAKGATPRTDSISSTATSPSAEPAKPAQPATATTATSAADDARVDFNRDVIPILSGNCFKCHGPDPGERKSGLRLDLRDKATGPADSGLRAIVPGKLQKSELARRIFAADPDERMPPPQSNKKLTDSQKQTLRRWIAEGAKYEPHWSFVPPRQAPPPPVQQTDWPRNELDYFVLSRLEAQGLHPSPEADRYTLVRRVYLDLIGLPPTVEEADAFASDAAPDAYERLVDGLLASPHFGERWARPWLDLARYSDTNGYEKDRSRTIWPYRDWVIQALNADMPFDEFTIEQLAGDMLPHATARQKIATGFHRNTMLNEEGGIDPLEYRYYALVDRVATTGTAWLGLTIACAQCHTHKFDPITHADYYRFMAFFNNADEPRMEIPDAELAARRAEIEAKIARLTDQLPEKFPLPPAQKWDDLAALTPSPLTGEGRGEGDGRGKTATPLTPGPSPAKGRGEKSDISPAKGHVSVAKVAADPRLIEIRRRAALDQAFAAAARDESARAAHWTVLRPVEMHSSMPRLTLLADDSVLASGDITKSDTYDLTFHTKLRGITAVRLEALPDDSLPNHGPGLAYYEGPFGDFYLSEINLSVDGKNQPFAAAAASSANSDFPPANAIDGNPNTGWSPAVQGQPQQAVFSLAQPTGEGKELKIRMLFERYYAAPLGRFRISVSTDPQARRSSALPPEIESVLVVPAEQRTDAQRERLMRYYLSVAPELAEARKEIDRLRASIPKPSMTLVMSERTAGQGRQTFVHHRGEFLQRDEEVQPGVPAFLPPLPAGAATNRLTLARWLVSPENPLSARVMVNRLWGACFGRGIVATTGDFGYQGNPPSNQELLDWLAVDFMQHGWSMKHVLRTIVTSAAYRQSSCVTSELLARDPQNLLCGRGPRFRLEAELIRDGALRASGLLSPKIGGPSVYPPQPASVTTEGTYGEVKWQASTGEDRYRRSLYTFSKRTAPFAMYNTFDAPSGEACVARREISNSPLQALTLLNDTVFLEAAESLGKTCAAMEASDEERATALFRRCLIRPPEKDEIEMLVSFAQRQRERLMKRELDAAKIAGTAAPTAAVVANTPAGPKVANATAAKTADAGAGSAAPTPAKAGATSGGGAAGQAPIASGSGNRGDLIKRAVWTAVARVVLNLDETITKN